MLLDLLLVVDRLGLALLRFFGFRLPFSSTSLRQSEVHLAAGEHVRAVPVVKFFKVFPFSRFGFFDLQFAATEPVAVELGHGPVGGVEVGVLDESEVVLDHDLDDVAELVEEVVQVALLDGRTEVADVYAGNRESAWVSRGHLLRVAASPPRRRCEPSRRTCH